MYLCVCTCSQQNKVQKCPTYAWNDIAKCHYKATGYFKGCGGISFAPVHENTIQYDFSLSSQQKRYRDVAVEDVQT